MMVIGAVAGANTGSCAATVTVLRGGSSSTCTRAPSSFELVDKLRPRLLLRGGLEEPRIGPYSCSASGPAPDPCSLRRTAGCPRQ